MNHVKDVVSYGVYVAHNLELMQATLFKREGLSLYTRDSVHTAATENPSPNKSARVPLTRVSKGYVS